MRRRRNYLKLREKLLGGRAPMPWEDGIEEQITGIVKKHVSETVRFIEDDKVERHCAASDVAGVRKTDTDEDDDAKAGSDLNDCRSDPKANDSSDLAADGSDDDTAAGKSYLSDFTEDAKAAGKSDLADASNNAKATDKAGLDDGNDIRTPLTSSICITKLPVQNMESVINGIANALEQAPENAAGTPNVKPPAGASATDHAARSDIQEIHMRREDKPLNDYGDASVALYATWGPLFLLRRGLQNGKPLSTKGQLRHMFTYFDKRCANW